jgi:hypothetical protein
LPVIVTDAFQYNDIRQQSGFKNVIIANRMTAESQSSQKCPFVDEADGEAFQKHQYHAFYMWVVVHELLGHGTGKMMMEEPKDVYNFDIDHPPINPLTGQPISSWYKPGQSWTGQFEDLATTVDECRCELVGAYLMDDVDLLALFGFDENSAIRPDDCEDPDPCIEESLADANSDILFLYSSCRIWPPRPGKLQRRDSGMFSRPLISASEIG